jgi:hypothetical protein
MLFPEQKDELWNDRRIIEQDGRPRNETAQSAFAGQGA